MIMYNKCCLTWWIKINDLQRNKDDNSYMTDIKKIKVAHMWV